MKERETMHYILSGLVILSEAGVIRMKIEKYLLQGAGVTLSQKHFRYI